jgi:flap endonuclease-1
MGLNIKDIVPRKELDFKDFKGKVVAVDAFNALYQFLSSIRQYDGTPLMDKKERVTSHLSGLLYRNMALLAEGIKIVYVFDGEAPELKRGTQEKRAEGKAIAKEKYEAAKSSDDVAGMKKYSSATIKLSDEIIKESKEFLEAMGIAVVQAPSEGEAQASVISFEGGVYAVGSQDYDCLAFGAPRLIQNLTLSRKRKTAGGVVDIKPEVIELNDVLKELEINQDQLICLGILVGTDYNPSGIKGIGQKKALKLVKEFKTPEKIFGSFDDLEFNWKEIFEMFKNPDVKKNVGIEFPEIDEDKIREILLDHDFGKERVEKQIEKLKLLKGKSSQKTLF